MFKQPNFNKVLVLDTNRKPLMPCFPARARKLLEKGRASVFRRYPFTIILHDRTVEESVLQDVEIKIDQGSKTTGVALVVHGKTESTVAFATHLEHRTNIKSLLDSRRIVRRSRRQRKTRYRAPRFLNRTRPKGWLPPSVKSKADNILNWVARFKKLTPISRYALENAGGVSRVSGRDCSDCVNRTCEVAANAGGVRVKFKVNPAAEPHDVKWYDYSQQILKTFHFPDDKPQHGNVVAINLETRKMEILTEDTKVAIGYPNDSYANLKILKDLVEASRFYYHEEKSYRYVWYPMEDKIVFIEPGMAGALTSYARSKGVSIGEDELAWLKERDG